MVALCAALIVATGQSPRAQATTTQAPALPSAPMTYGFLTATFAADGTFEMTGQGWPKLTGTWKAAGGEVTDAAPLSGEPSSIAGVIQTAATARPRIR